MGYIKNLFGLVTGYKKIIGIVFAFTALVTYLLYLHTSSIKEATLTLTKENSRLALLNYENETSIKILGDYINKKNEIIDDLNRTIIAYEYNNATALILRDADNLFGSDKNCYGGKYDVKTKSNSVFDISNYGS